MEDLILKQNSTKNSFLKTSIVVLSFLLMSCNINPTSYNIVKIQTPNNCSIILYNDSDFFVEIPPDSTYSLQDEEHARYSFKVKCPIDNYALKVQSNVNIAELSSRNEGLLYLSSNGFLNLSYLLLENVMIKAPSDNKLIVSKDNAIVKIIEPNSSFSITDFENTKYDFSIKESKENYELISLGDNVIIDSLSSGSFFIGDKQLVNLEYKLMPSISIEAPKLCSVNYNFEKNEIDRKSVV